MNQKSTQPRRNRKPVIVGTGLIALDVVISQQSQSATRCYAGGTCGNVLTILSFLGWDSFPMARTNGDFTSQWLREDLSRFSVHADYLSLEPTGPVPAIIEWLGARKDGTPSHKYSFVCPTCGSRKPGHKPLSFRAVSQLVPSMSVPDVFFFDRVSRAALLLAKAFRRKGSLIVFEPSGVGVPKLFKEALAVTHVLKYSNDRMGKVILNHRRDSIQLEIETLGEQGMRFRTRLSGFRTRGWRHLDAFPVTKLKDAAGSGDWLTAAILNRIGRSAAAGFKRISQKELLIAFRFAQAAATWNCGFAAPRGGMYSTDVDRFIKEVEAIAGGTTLDTREYKNSSINEHRTSPNGACLNCQAPHRPHAVHVATH
jgi:fructokinase